MKDKINKLYPFAGENVSITLESSQMSIDEFYEEQHEGVEYNVNPDGTTNVAPGQLKLLMKKVLLNKYLSWASA